MKVKSNSLQYIKFKNKIEGDYVLYYTYTKVVEAKVRTDKLYCSSCRKFLKVRSIATFELNESSYGHRRMINAYCRECANELDIYSNDVDYILDEVIGHGQC